MNPQLTNDALGLTPAQRDLMARLLREELGDRPERETPIDRPAEGVPLSFAQQRLWFFDQLAPGNPVYNIPTTLRLRGPLDVAALEQALRLVLMRHEALRTVFTTIDGRPVQRPVPATDVAWTLTLTDLSGEGAPEARLAAARELSRRHARQPFDLQSGCLLRAAVVRLADDDHLALFCLHHIAGDGWSTGVFIREMAEGYAAYRDGREPTLPALPLQYADVALEQRQRLQGAELARQLAWWQAQLAEAPPLELPTDRPRPAAPSFRGTRLNWDISAELTAGLRRVAGQEQATLFMVLLAAWQMVLGKWAGQTDVVVGSPIANRTRAEVEGLIGFFVNTLALRGQWTNREPFRALLRRTRETTLGAYAHQDLPFEALVEALHPTRQANRNPVFQVAFALQNAIRDTLVLPGLHVESVFDEWVTSKFDITLTMAEHHGGLLATFEYSTELFDHTTIERLREHFDDVLRQIARDPDREIRDVRLPAAPVRPRIQADTTVMPPIHRFEQHASRQGQRVAITDGTSRWTYAELDARAEHIARLGRAIGIGPEDRVALFLDRSLDLVAAILAVHKMGAAYVPLDPASPLERLQYLCDDARPSLVLTTSSAAVRLPRHDCPVLRIDEAHSEHSAGIVDMPDDTRRPVDAASAAYYIYTSGSTGKPKGVCVTHDNVARLLDRTAHWFAFSEQDVWTLFHSFAFDFSVWELWGALAHGGTLVVVPHAVSRDPAELHRWVQREGVTVLNQTPSAFRGFMRADEDGGTPPLDLRYVIFGGESLDPRTLAGWFERRGDERPTLVNMYGITETTVHVTYRVLTRKDAANSASVIGEAIPDLTAYVVDSSGHLAPIGTPGEICVAGEGLARGYARNPALTAERFVPEPFSGIAGARMYRSGDRARRLASGELEYLGRLDQQVKIRGFRIEPGEIEAALAEHPAVDAAVVIAEGDGSGSQSLAAFVTVRDGGVAPADFEADAMRGWHALYEETYLADADSLSPTFAGWNSSYTGAPIPKHEMEEWLSRTLDRLRPLEPQSCLEIGCGTGLIALALAPDCREYVATDFSETALGGVRRRLAHRGLDRVRLFHRRADEFDGLPSQHFDLVILNSVVQYFPGETYMRAVLAGAIARVRPGGAVFIGDVRHLGLLEPFIAGIEGRCEPAVLPQDLLARVRRRVEEEEELLLSPAFFVRLADQDNRIAAVELLPKLCASANELTNYRFDAIVHVGPRPSETSPVTWLEWSDLTSLERLRQVLATADSATGVLRIPNGRVLGDVALLRPGSDGRTTDANLSELAPFHIAALADSSGCEVDFDFSRCDGETFDAVFWPSRAPRPPVAAIAWPGRAVPAGAQLASEPLRKQRGHRTAEQLREFLRERLPEYMVPARVTVVDQWPLNANGKVDRRALAALPRAVRAATAGSGQPRTAIEWVLAEIWKELLFLEQPDIHDDFFTLGGHSLLATQVVSRIRARYGVSLPLRAIFESPTIAGLARHVTTALAGSYDHFADAAKSGARPAEGVPLSFAQQRLWFFDQLVPGNPVYNIPAALRLRGRLDVAALERALRLILTRHEALRTVFTAVEGRPVQRALPAAEVAWSLELLDLSGQDSPEARLAAARELSRQHARQPFDLRSGCLLRAALVRLADDDHLALFCLHHIAGDGWSMGVLVRELTAGYTAYRDGREPELPPLPLQYADVALEQRQRLQGAELTRHLTWWQEQLKNAPELELPTDRPRPAAPTFRGARLNWHVSAEVTADLRRVAGQEQATLFMVLLAAWQVVLGKWAGQTDVVVGSPIANRTREEVEGLIGFFVNTLALRGRWTNREPFRALLRRTRETTLGAYAHQDLPFEALVEALHPARQANRNPVFQVAFALQNASRDTLALPGLQVESVSDPGVTSKFDITLMMGERHGGLLATFEYSTELFDHATIERLREHFDDVLRQVARNPDGQIRDVRLPAAPVPPRLAADTSAHLPIRRFEQHARRHPQSVAVVDGTAQWTYAELNERADRIARFGRRVGVRPEDRVGLFLDRSADLVAAALAVHKMGAAYVPLDPASPLDRLQYICDDARPSLVLTTSTEAVRLPRLECSILRVDDELAASASDTPGEPSRSPDAASAAYYIYTSGSTGKPKGVCVTHGNVARLLDRTAQWFAFSERDVWTLFHSFAFDFSVWELWGALAYGGRLVVVPHAVSRDPVELHRWVRREGVTVLNQTPSAFRGFMRADEDAGTAPLDLRYVIFGGESLDPRVLAGWFERRGDEQPTLVNMYGITETTVHVTYRVLTRKDAAGSASVIGEAIPDLTAYVVDSSGHLAPIGAPGEICVAGEGLARGYAQNPALTAERFVPEPFSGMAGARMYRSGDRARRLASGDLEYLGRLDQQVKIRGFRIEPGEIEAALREHPGVREAVVIARGNDADRRLFAYYIPVDAPLPAGDLRAFAAARLPEYMLPAAFTAIGHLPTNINGKLDLDALPEPAVGDVRTGRAMVPPRGPVEAALVEIWSDVLAVPLVGIEDNFFELGGDSIRALEVRTRAEARGIEFSLQQLFQTPAIAQLAAAAAVKSDVVVAPRALAPFGLLAPADRNRLPDDVEDAWPLSRLQSGMVFHSELSRDTAVYHDVFSYHLRMPFDRAALREAVCRLMGRHPVLRTSFALDAFVEPVQLVHREVDFDIDVADWRALPDTEQTARLETWLEGERHRAFDWARAPLFRIHLHQRSDDSFQFTFSFHHAILDGWSVASFLTELFETYQAVREDGAPERPALKAAYADFIRLERLALKSEACRQFWARELSGAVPEAIPRLSSPTASSPRTVGGHDVGLDERLSEGLHRAAAAAGVPIKSLLLAAHLHVLSILAGRADIVTGIVSHGRPEAPDGEKILGLFLNTLPFRYRCRRESWRELATHVFAHERESLPHRWYPMSQMRKDANASELFDTAFNFIHFHVLQRIEQDDSARTLDASIFEETNFDFVADFSQSLSTQQLHLVLRHSSSAFDSSRVAAIADLYRHVLSQAAADIDAPVRVANTSPPAQMAQLRAWSSAVRETAGQSMVLPAIRAQRDRSPDAIAVVAGEEKLTYGELVERVGALAAQISRAGVEGDGRVGVCMQRSPDLVVAILAVLQAGAAYVPLDAEYPGERLRFMAEDAAISLALVDAPGAAALHSCAMTLLPATAWSRHGVDDLEPHTATPEHAAYVLYTSGSTGTPKGVVVTQAALANHMAWMLKRFEFGAGDRTLLKTPVSFDASVWEYLAPLMSGGTLVVAPPGAHRDPAKLAECINTHGVTVLQTVPSLLRALLDEPRFGTCVSLRHLFCGGEALASDLRDTLWRILPAVALHNLYGPTEATIDATSYSCERGESGTVPIGTPIAGLEALVLDEFGELAPVGTPGELWLGGRGLAQGYLNRPAETALRFIPHPFATSGGGRLYRTGDRARWLPSGLLEYLGRTDGQTKLHGYRIEVGEIEARLAMHAAVRQAVVVMRREGDRDLLVAYVQAVTGSEASAGQLREHLRRTLPGYMIPARFVTLADWPLAPNGKIDRRALSRIEAGEPPLRALAAAAMTVVQREVLGVCRDLLAAGDVALDDNFFALGGDSILALQLLSRLRRRFDLRLELQQLLDAPDIRAIAALIAAQQLQPKAAPSILRQEHRSLLVELRPGLRDDSLFLVHPFGGSVFLYRELALRMPPEVRVVGIQAQGFDGVGAPLSSVTEMAQLYLALVRERVAEGPYLLAGHSFGGVLAYEIACLLAAAGTAVPLVAMIDSGPPQQLTLDDASTSVEYLAVLTGIRPEEYVTGDGHSDEHQLQALLDGLRRANKLPAGFDPSHLRTLLPLWKAHARAIREYRPTLSDVTVDLFRARERHRGEDRHPEAFWGRAARGGVRVSVAGGNHHTMLMPPHVDALAEDLSSLISDVLQASQGSQPFK